MGNASQKRHVAEDTSGQFTMIARSKGQESNMLAQIQKSPMSICVDATLWQTYKGGVITASSKCGTSIDHAVQATGFNAQGNYWIIRNSWGAGWGEKGFVWVEYGHNVCGVTDQATIVNVEKIMGMEPAPVQSAPVGELQCTYPGGQCYELRMQKCKQGATAGKMTLHGLWAEWGNGCKGAAYDASLMTSIKTELESKWVSCPEDGNENDSFWSHEWTKHGTCSGMDQLTFFKKTLSLFDQHVKECPDSDDCAICFTKTLDALETCPSMAKETVQV